MTELGILTLPPAKLPAGGIQFGIGYTVRVSIASPECQTNQQLSRQIDRFLLG
jgi:hypothetical protein